MIKRTAILLIVAIFLAGCTAKPPQGEIRGHMVTDITVTCDTCDTFTRRYYSDPDKIRIILLTIRKLGPDFPAQVDAAALEGKILSIQMDCMDGSQVNYRIKNNLYLQKNGGDWRQINSKAVPGFFQMLLQIPADEERTASWDPLFALPEHRLNTYGSGRWRAW